MADVNQNTDDLASMVRVLVEPLIEFKDELEINATEEDGIVYVDIKTNADDSGKVIGRGGRIIKSIRTLARAAGSRRGVDVEVELLD